MKWLALFYFAYSYNPCIYCCKISFLTNDTIVQSVAVVTFGLSSLYAQAAEAQINGCIPLLWGLPTFSAVRMQVPWATKRLSRKLSHMAR